MSLNSNNEEELHSNSTKTPKLFVYDVCKTKQVYFYKSKQVNLKNNFFLLTTDNILGKYNLPRLTILDLCIIAF